MDAAARVAEGDYTARATVQGPPDVRDLARAFNRMAERLETNEEQRRNLLADVAHELRTPLSVIRGRVEGMADGLYEPGGDDLALIGAETTVMARLLDDLQLLSNAEAGALRLHRERLEADELVETAESAHRTEAAERGVALRTQVTAGPARARRRPGSDRRGARQPGLERAPPHALGRHRHDRRGS